jgi:hypothetical protein
MKSMIYRQRQQPVLELPLLRQGVDSKACLRLAAGSLGLCYRQKKAFVRIEINRNYLGTKHERDVESFQQCRPVRLGSQPEIAWQIRKSS